MDIYNIGAPVRSTISITRSSSTSTSKTSGLIRDKGFDGEALTELIKMLVVLDSEWIPKEQGYSLYVRMFSACI